MYVWHRNVAELAISVNQSDLNFHVSMFFTADWPRLRFLKGVAQIMEAGILSERAISSLAVASVHFVLGFLFTLISARYKKLSRSEQLILFWLFYDAIVHFTLVSI